MKSEKGVTLVSLIVYVIAMVIVVAIVSVISSYFYKNINEVTGNSDPYKEYTKFNNYFSEEANKENIKILECNLQNENGNNYIVFNNNVQYEFIKENKGIYRNNIKICSNIDDCKFEQSIKKGKDIVTVTFKSGNLTNQIIYTLKN